MSERQKIKRVILFGYTGMLGRYVYSYFVNHTNVTLTKVDFRISSDTIESLEKVLIENEINEETCVINCIGLIPQRKSVLSMDKDYFLVNSIFPHMLWNYCKKYNAKMIQPTTDCVFSGKRGFYVENDIHDETSAYGSSKSLGEPIGCTIIRTSIIGKELVNKKSFLEWVISNNNNKISGFTDHSWNGITCLEYCKIIEQIIMDNLFWVGIRHIYSPTPKSKYELACIIADTFNLTIEIEPLESSIALNKTLLSIHKNLFEIKELKKQINDLKDYSLI